MTKVKCYVSVQVTYLLDIKIIRVLIPLRTILHGYRNSAMLLQLGRVQQGTEAI